MCDDGINKAGSVIVTDDVYRLPILFFRTIKFGVLHCSVNITTDLIVRPIPFMASLHWHLNIQTILHTLVTEYYTLSYGCIRQNANKIMNLYEISGAVYNGLTL